MDTIHHIAGAAAVLFVAAAFIAARADPLLSIPTVWLIGELIG